MRPILLLLLALLGTAESALAQGVAWRCVRNGQVVYQQTPCAGRVVGDKDRRTLAQKQRERDAAKREREKAAEQKAAAAEAAASAASGPEASATATAPPPLNNTVDKPAAKAPAAKRVPASKS